jgi:outer membrane protein assembly factor BamB
MSTSRKLVPGFGCLTVACLVTWSPGHLVTLSSADWPGWRGADRSGVSAETGLLKEWPKDGPPLDWKATGLGIGFSTPSVANGRLFVLGTRGGDEYVFALDVKDGKKVWESKLGPGARVQYPGPRSTPIVDGDRLFALSSDGDLACLEVADGKAVWQKQLRKDFGGVYGKWAYAESPLIDGDVLVCAPGGGRASVVALKKANGELVWKTEVARGNQAAYSSTIVAQVGGVKQYVQFLNGGVVGVAATDGKLLWRYDKTSNGLTNCPTPIFHDDCLFTSTAGVRGGGAGLVKLTAAAGGVTAKEVYFLREFANHHGGIVRVGDYLYGTTQSSLLCVDFKTGEKKWQSRSVGKGSVSAADGHLYVRSERGPVALVEATPEGYKEKGRFDQPNRSRHNAWPHPVIAGGRLYLRDDDVLLCYDVKAK